MRNAPILLALLLLGGPVVAQPEPMDRAALIAQAIDAGRLTQAEAMLRAEASNGLAERDRLQARLAVKAGRDEQALALFSGPEMAASLDCSDRIYAATAALRLRRLELASSLLKPALESCSGNARIWDLWGIAGDFDRNWSQADDAYRRAGALASDDADIPNDLAASLMLRGRFRDALRQLDRARLLRGGDRRIENNIDIARGALGLEPLIDAADSPERRAERYANAARSAFANGRAAAGMRFQSIAEIASDLMPERLPDQGLGGTR